MKNGLWWMTVPVLVLSGCEKKEDPAVARLRERREKRAEAKKPPVEAPAQKAEEVATELVGEGGPISSEEVDTKVKETLLAYLKNRIECHASLNEVREIRRKQKETPAVTPEDIEKRRMAVETEAQLKEMWSKSADGRVGLEPYSSMSRDSKVGRTVRLGLKLDDILIRSVNHSDELAVITDGGEASPENLKRGAELVELIQKEEKAMQELTQEIAALKD